jgi:hypothetical protein
VHPGAAVDLGRVLAGEQGDAHGGSLPAGALPVSGAGGAAGADGPVTA